MNTDTDLLSTGGEVIYWDPETERHHNDLFVKEGTPWDDMREQWSHAC